MSSSNIPRMNGRDVGTNSTRGANDLPVNVPMLGNHYNLSNRQYISGRFGELIPVYCGEGIEREYFSFKNDINLMVDKPLLSPVLSDIFLHRFTSIVPMESIYPNSWKQLKNIPIHDSDVPSDAWSFIDLANVWRFMTDCITYIGNYQPQIGNNFVPAFAALLALCNFFRADSFVCGLGLCNKGVPSYSSSSSGPYTDSWDFVDKFLDGLISDTGLKGNYPTQSASRYYGSFKLDTPQSRIEFLDYVYSTDLSVLETMLSPTQSSTLLTSIVSYCKAFKIVYFEFPKVSLAPVLAYQQIAAEFFTSDDVDDIYNSTRYMNVLESLITDIAKTKDYDLYFLYEGSKVFYDAISSYYFDMIYGECAPSTDREACLYFVLLFNPCFALKYGDYFTGGRIQPLATGDSSDYIDVDTAKGVKTLDINQNILMIRLRQVINRVGSDARKQMYALFGIVPDEGNTSPKYMFHDKHLLNKSLVVNTAAPQSEQAKEVSKLGQMASNINVSDIMSKSANVMIDSNSLVISFVYFDAKNTYPFASYRFWFKHDRFDYFNSMLQNYGDDMIPLNEVNCHFPTDTLVPFSYVARFNDYRQSYNRACGAFCTSKELQSWFYLPSERGNQGYFVRNLREGSHYLRVMPNTFNRFYAKTASYGSLGYHFLLDVQNCVDVYSPVALSPDILFGTPSH